MWLQVCNLYTKLLDYVLETKLFCSFFLLGKTGSMALDCSGQSCEGKGVLYSLVIWIWVDVAIFYIVQGTDGMNSVKKIDPSQIPTISKI